MKVIPLTQGKVALVDDADFRRVNQFKWCAMRVRKGFYAVRNSPRENGKSKLILMHSFLLGGRADHIDGDGLDNQRRNIRLASNQQNLRAFQTKSTRCSSHYRGVYWSKRNKKWLVEIRLRPKKKKHIGLFDSEVEAAIAYNAAAIARDPKFHYLNKI